MARDIYVWRRVLDLHLRAPVPMVAPVYHWEDGVGMARGTTGEARSRVYSVGWDGESAPPAVQKLLAGFRDKGMVEEIWQHTEKEFRRITEQDEGSHASREVGEAFRRSGGPWKVSQDFDSLRSMRRHPKLISNEDGAEYVVQSAWLVCHL